MPTIYDLKPKFQALLRPVCAALARVGVTANQVTIAAFLLSLAHGAAIAATAGADWVLWVLPIVLFIRMAMNAIDGMLAREFGQKSNLGAILNELTDVLSDVALYLPFALIAGMPPVLVVMVVLFAVIAEMTGVVGIQIGASRRYDGPFGKSDRAFFFGALALLLIFFEPGWWSTTLIAFAAALGLATIVNRARMALKEAGKGADHANT
ncbi:CDP-alcohol phosphatidyltransferase family protein [Hyphococcus flavus]|uniref:CDP-alcohol phosphatidyltransferase family protein n=1 Tax=Hyphococcus flavus TaxID=1866326 RepID=A0AAF0CEE9_9PROT|nr:CDP-alcohol phosphatidyltransferase family protein [Hyphococcus flavus]WDI30059.1 CDP-alcohol phosphatidyltransferase family protein [Hyphococcus flavus]